MKVINYTNIKAVERILRILATGVDTADLVVYITFPNIEEEKFNGLFIDDKPPTIKIFMRKNNNVYYKPAKRLIAIRNYCQFIAYIFLHEFYHYAARLKNFRYANEREENLADQYAYDTLKKAGLTL
ncbi:MAG: hypothetical protein KJ593_07575 [Candidatus Omnitrophica bacterium]|nr:hypothetical protein [Candidatus Omnitrophota bacterium]